MDGKAALRRLQSADEQTVPVDQLKTDEALQPRADRLVPYRHKGRTSDSSADAIGRMRQLLEANKQTELEPILVAEKDGELEVVDGHHRVKAYLLAKRNTIPARVCSLSRKEAVMASKVANCMLPRSLEMHEEQRREAAWQYLADVTLRGKRGLPRGETGNAIAALFGIGRATVQRMLKRLPTVAPSEYNAEASDPGTGFPCWRYVRESKQNWKDMAETMSMDQLKQHKAHKIAAKVAAMMDGVDPDVVRMVADILRQDAKEATADEDSIRELAYAIEDGDGSDF